MGNFSMYNDFSNKPISSEKHHREYMEVIKESLPRFKDEERHSKDLEKLAYHTKEFARLKQERLTSQVAKARNDETRTKYASQLEKHTKKYGEGHDMKQHGESSPYKSSR